MSVKGEKEVLASLLKYRHYIDKNARKAVKNGAKSFKEVLTYNTPVSRTEDEHLKEHIIESGLKTTTGTYQVEVGYDRQVGWRVHFPNSGTVKQKPQRFIEKSRSKSESKVRQEFIEALKV